MKLRLAHHELAQLADFQRRHRVSLMCMVAVELADAPQLRQRLGDTEAQRLILQHDQILRDLLASFPGGLEVNSGAGAFFLVFDRPSEAVRFAAEWQERLARLARATRHKLAARQGIHLGEVLVDQPGEAGGPRQLNGLEADKCLALIELAGPGQILLTRSAFDTAQQGLKSATGAGSDELTWTSHGGYEFSDLGAVLEVCEVNARTTPKAPAGNGRVRRLAGQFDTRIFKARHQSSWRELWERVCRPSPEDRRAALLGSAAVALVGAVVLLAGWADALSYDLTHWFRPAHEPPGVVIVEMDEESSTVLRQQRRLVWDRRLYAQLLDRLRADGARAVGFDVLFVGDEGEPNRDEPGEPVNEAGLSPEDRELRRALRDFPRVVLGARLDLGTLGGSRVRMPADSFRDVARWGVVEQAPRGRAIRRPWALFHSRPGLAATLLEVAGETPAAIPRQAWLGYYGPAGTIRHHRFANVLSNTFPRGAFSNQIVLVGANLTTDFINQSATDRFHSPHTRWTGREMPGVEVNATSVANLLQRGWLRRLPPWVELALVLLMGAAAGYGLVFLDAMRAAVFGLILTALAAVLIPAQTAATQVWFPWLVLAGVQLPLSVGWAVLTDSRRPRVVVAEPAPAPPPAGQPDSLAGGPGGTVRIPERPQPRVPDHELLRCIGQGAYGEVWLARDIIGGHRAVKILRRSAFTDAAPFEREFKGLQHYTPISRSHPGLVHILHVGRNDEDGFIYYMMEAGDDLATGTAIIPDTYAPRTLGTDIDARGALPLGEVIPLALALAEALEFLHGSGLVHRDLKPANIIFVRGRPKLADIGLVTQIARAGQEVTFVGTHGYMPPEGPGAPSADLFSLGKLLYVAVTGRPAKDFPMIPDGLVPPGLSEEPLHRFFGLLLRLCEPIQAERYQAAGELLTDLRELAAWLATDSAWRLRPPEGGHLRAGSP